MFSTLIISLTLTTGLGLGYPHDDDLLYLPAGVCVGISVIALGVWNKVRQGA
jgi:hypothetical protein